MASEAAKLRFFLGQTLYKQQLKKRMRSPAHEELNVHSRNRCLGVVLILSTVFSGMIQELKSLLTPGLVSLFYLPVTHGEFSASGVATLLGSDKKMPNVLFMVHESLSGSILGKTKEGTKATPFFQSLMEEDDFYFFQHSRSTSARTMDCVPSLLTGCLPLDDHGRRLVLERSIGSELKRQGYTTAGITSFPKMFENAPWLMLHDHLTCEKTIDEKECHDLDVLPRLNEWMKQERKEPFYGQIYTYNQHDPFWGFNNRLESDTERYVSSLETFDSFLMRLFEMLEESGHLNNTIIFGSGDHGEHPNQRHLRGYRFEPDIINPATYIWAPNHLFPSESKRQRLKANTKQAVSILDLFPTLQHFLYGGDANETANIRAEWQASDTSSDYALDHCATGFDLLSTEISDERLTVQWNQLSIERRWHRKGLFIGGLSGKKQGIYVVEDGKNRGGKIRGLHTHTQDLDFGQCSTELYANCSKPLTEEQKEKWKETLANLKAPFMLSEQIKRSDLIRRLRLEVLDSPMENFQYEER